MKKVFKVLGILIGLVALLAAAGAAYIHVDGIPTYEAHPPDIKVTADSAMVAEGTRLASMLCKRCHLADNGLLEGNRIDDLPPMFGKAWSANITRDTKYGSGRIQMGNLCICFAQGLSVMEIMLRHGCQNFQTFLTRICIQSLRISGQTHLN